ncbi:MAG: MAPEG family protein [Mariprofundaceae bacterium]|nr:MAPEG family protein [Mariprofundaceae bacterium]
MQQSDIFFPCIAMVALTAAVWVRLYVERVGEMRARRIRPEEIATVQQAATLLEKQNSANNFRNLFEVPVLFYVLCLALFASQMATPLLLVGAWLFVAFRAAHSLIHCSYNHVIHRFIVYSLSTILLFIMWGMFAFNLYGPG